MFVGSVPGGEPTPRLGSGERQPNTVMCTWFLWLAESLPRPAMARQPSLLRATDQMRPCQMRYSTPSLPALDLSQLVTFHPRSRAGPVAAVPIELPKVPSQARPSGCSDFWPGRGDQHEQ